MPHFPAAVAAPILKLCPAYFSAGYPASLYADRTSATKLALVRYFPSSSLKSGPGVSPLMTIKLRTAATGHILELSGSNIQCYTLPEGVGLRCLQSTCRYVGLW